MSAHAKFTLLLLVLAVCSTGVMVNTLLRRETIKPVDLYSAVATQIEALQEDDFPRAYESASSGFQQKFNAGQFEEMIRASYRSVMRAARVEYGSVIVKDRRAIVEVFFIDESGEVRPCIYSLVKEEKSWKIDGARFERRWQRSYRLGGTRT